MTKAGVKFGCSEGCINSKFNPVWPILDHYIPNKKLRFLIFQTWIQVLKWSVADAHPDSRVLSILNFSGLFKICMRGIFYSLRDTLLFKCSEFLSLWSFWSGLDQIHIQMIESGNSDSDSLCIVRKCKQEIPSVCTTSDIFIYIKVPLILKKIWSGFLLTNRVELIFST